MLLRNTAVWKKHLEGIQDPHLMKSYPGVEICMKKNITFFTLFSFLTTISTWVPFFIVV